MKFILTAVTACLTAITSFAQVGIGTVSPNSTLDVRGSFSAIYRSFSSATNLGSNDYTVVFTGSSATTATLPDATTCPGRIYCVKNFSAGPVPATLTIGTVSSQKIDGAATWPMTDLNGTITIGSDGANWEIFSQSIPSTSGNYWNQGGNPVAGLRTLGTTTAFDLPFITNNTEKMRITSAGNIGIGSNAFSVNPEALLVYQNNATSFNVIAGKGNLNNYLQLNIQNLNAGTNASSDLVATADNGTELVNYVDLGINSSANTSAVMGAADDAYLYTAGNNFLVGTGTAGKALIFLTGGTSQATNERMRIDGSGNLGIGTNAPTQKLHVNGNINFSGALMPAASSGSVGDYLVSTGAGSAPVWFNPTPYIGSVAWSLGGNSVAAIQKFGTTTNFDLPILTNNIERMHITNTGNVAVDPPTGVAAFNATNPEKLLVDAGTTTSVNAIVGKGTSATYLQLNIQNLSNGVGASSDVVATADNGTELVDFVDMGINSSTNTSNVMGAANDAYLYTTGNNFLIGTGTAAKALVFMTGGTTQATNERMRVDGSGNVGINATTPSSTLQIRGSVSLSVTTKTANATVAAIDYTTLCNNTSGAITITLPTAAGIGGRIYIIKKISGVGNNVTVACFGAETIDGSATNLITVQYASIMIQSDGTNWYILSKN